MSDPEPMQPLGSAEADARIHAAIKVISDLLKQPQLVGLDFADLPLVLRQVDGCGGQAVCGHGVASGPDRGVKAADAALADLKDQLAALWASETGRR